MKPRNALPVTAALLLLAVGVMVGQKSPTDGLVLVVAGIAVAAVSFYARW